MTYLTQARLARDETIRDRVAACAATQEVGDCLMWASTHMWALSAEPGWDAAYSYALLVHAEDPDYLPGADEGVVTDGMILSAVQAVLGRG